MKNKKNLISALILLGGIPVIMAVGFLLFGGKQYAFISAGVAVLSCVPFFMSFERNSDNNSVKLVIIAVMTALSVTGRVLCESNDKPSLLALLVLLKRLDLYALKS